MSSIIQRKAPDGSGSIRKREVTKNGKKYVYWEGRFTCGFDSGTGKQKQRTITGKTQKEVAQKMREATVAVDTNTLTEPTRMTVSQWLDIWAEEYLCNLKPNTAYAYKASIRNNIKPYLGAIKLNQLMPHDIQSFYNELSERVSPKTVKNTHGIFRRALQQAVANRYLNINPADSCILPRVEKREMHPLDDFQIADFLKAIKGHQFEALYTVALFTGMREGEVLGLTWDCVNFIRGTITINKQLQQPRGGGPRSLVSPKNGRSRNLTPAPFLMTILQQVKRKQMEWKLEAGAQFQNLMNLVFTNPTGGYLASQTVYNNFKAIAEKIGAPETRFHDLRHSYAVASIRSGDDIKTVQGNLGHATAAFTLDVYGHVTDQMQKESAARMEQYFHLVASA